MAAQAKPGVQERILLHLLDYSDFKDSIEVPFALSQMGIANAVAIARSNVPRAIAGLKDQNILVERQAHVKYYSQKLFNEYPDPIVNYKNWRGHFREGDYLLHFPGTFCGLSPSGEYTDVHLLSCLHRFTIHFVAAM